MTTEANKEEQILKSPWSGKDNTENEKREIERERERKDGATKTRAEKRFPATA